MICLAVLESSRLKKELIRQWVRRYASKQKCGLEILWLLDQDPLAKVEKYAMGMQIALINLDSDKGEACGRALYERNPDCRILYYRSEPCSLVHLLRTRPISFYLWTQDEEKFLEKFDAVYQEVLLAQSSFCYETKSKMYLIPKCNILYFQSDLRYVNISLVHGEHPRILAKLSEMEPLAGDAFVRIHKSYLVNSRYVLWLDKKNHFVLMTNGEQLPVSDAQYDRVCERLRSTR